MKSALYRGWMRHRRALPRAHDFRYDLFMMYLDLAELDSVFAGRWFWSARRTALARFRRADYLGDPTMPLADAVRDLVAERTGERPDGPIRLLTHLAYFGYGFNPVSFYYCFDAADTRVETIVAEVNNTPWGEQHCYVLDQAHAPRQGMLARHQFDKDFHVSPFMPMEIGYDWMFGDPGEKLVVHMILNSRPESAGGEGPQEMFDATLHLERQAITGASLAGVLMRFPLMTLQVIVGIHWQALRLWLKGVPVFTHRDKPVAAAGTANIPAGAAKTPDRLHTLETPT
jgi:DUF1365 family protein